MKKSENTDYVSPDQATAKRKRNSGLQQHIKRAGERFQSSRGGSLTLPTPDEARGYLQGLAAAHGLRTARADFSFLLMAAAEIWGAENTAVFARVLREHSVGAKPALKSRWEAVDTAIERLPPDWQSAFRMVADRSKRARSGARGLILSASRLLAVVAALARWVEFCNVHGQSHCPTGQTLASYADHLLRSDTVTINSAGYYLERIVTGYFVIATDSPVPPGVDYIVKQISGAKQPAASKTASQVVGASKIYALGLELFRSAQQRPFHGTEAAIQARDAVLLMLAAAIGKRAQSLSALAFDRTLTLGPRPQILFDLPGSALKMAQAAKATTRKREEVSNGQLWDVLTEYKTRFRPIFDSGDAVFPSMLAMGHALIEQRLSNIVGELTARHLKVRIPLHRIRDNVATEAVEQLASGLSVAAGVLGHLDESTTNKHYVRQQGRVAMAKLAKLTQEARGKRTTLRL